MVAEVRKFVALEVARIAGRSPAMDVVANKLKMLAKAASMQHRGDGTFGDSIVTVRARNRRSKGVEDRVVMVTDPLGAIKEFGHVIRKEKGGPAVGYVPGQHSLQRAVTRMPGVSGD